MDSANAALVGQSQNNSNESSPPADLPPEAIALASRFFDAARNGHIDLLTQALARGLPADLTNDKGDSLVRPPFDSTSCSNTHHCRSVPGPLFRCSRTPIRIQSFSQFQH
jgi:hypothetical protein